MMRSCERPAGEANRGVKEAMRVTADAITQCKFEATDPASDEIVLYNILQVRQEQPFALRVG